MTAPGHAALADLVAYSRRELPPHEEALVEEHFFACERCARALESIERLRAGTVSLVRAGRVAASASASLAARAEGEGVRVRTYRLARGEQVACTASPEDDLVVIRLAGDFGGLERVDLSLEATDLATGARETRRVEDVAVDHVAGEIVLLYPGELVRGIPRSLLRYEVYSGDAARLLGTYRLDHTPWAERAGGG